MNRGDRQLQKTCPLRNLLLQLLRHLLFQFLYPDGTKIEKVGLYCTCRPGTKTGTINVTINVKVNSEEDTFSALVAEVRDFLNADGHQSQTTRIYDLEGVNRSDEDSVTVL